MKLLEDMTDWVKEVPLAPQAAQRFGNLAFREYIALVESVRQGRQLSTDLLALTSLLRGSIDTGTASRTATSAVAKFKCSRTRHKTGLWDGT
jgi:hypothetical protein